MTLDRIIVGDVLAGLRELPDGCVQTCVTSPPYWGLRDYGVAGQIGSEPTVEAWVSKMVEVFSEVRRVLRDDGTLWLNLGDSYARDGGEVTRPGATAKAGNTLANVDARQQQRAASIGLKPKDLIGQPWRVAFALQADGWWLRSEIIWHKPNPMPESVTDRPTKSHEQIFLLTKAERYYYDAYAAREPATMTGGGLKHAGNKEAAALGRDRESPANSRFSSYKPSSRNLRTVWTIPTAPYPEAHFATFPPEIPKRCILAGTSAKGACAECGAPWEREIEAGELIGEDRGGNYKGREREADRAGASRMSGTIGGDKPGMQREKRTTGWRPTCVCPPTETVPCLVLDPFAGSGTTLAVAQGLARSYVGIELNPEYAKLAQNRIGVMTPGLALS